MKNVFFAVLALAVSIPATAGDKHTVLRELLAEQETQLAAAEADLTRAQNELRIARLNKVQARAISLVFSAASVAGIVVAYRLTHNAGQYPYVTASLETQHLATALVVTGSVTLVSSAAVYTFAGRDIPKWETAVAERLELVRQALERVARAKLALEGEKK